MVQEGFKRKLTAILSADVVGYSRLMEDNEEATIQTLNTYRYSMSTLIQQHRGRVVDTTGDNLMAEFSSVVDAVKCAVETQKEMSERNADLPEKRRGPPSLIWPTSLVGTIACPDRKKCKKATRWTSI